MIKIESYPGFSNLRSQQPFALIFIMLAGLFAVTQLGSNNLELFTAINQHAHLFLGDAFWTHITDFGNGALAGVIALATLVLYPQLSKRLLITILLSAVVINVSKDFFDAIRPPGILPLDQIHLVGHAITKNSFPSGHTATAFVLAGYIWLSFSNIWLRSIVLLLAILVGLSRSAIGVHWPEDITSGATLGWLLAWISAWLSRNDLSSIRNYIFLALIALVNLAKIIATPDVSFIQLNLIGIIPLWMTAWLVTTSFARWGNYTSAIFLALAAIIGTATGPVDFEMIPGIQKVRWLFAGIALILMLYFFARLLMLRPKIDVWARGRIEWVIQFQNWLPVRFSKFALVGFTGFLIDSLVYLVVQSAGVPHLGARAASYWVSATCNWYLNRIFTFNDADDENKLIQWIKYLTMCSGSFVLNWGSYYVLTQYVEFFIEYKFIAFVIGIAMGMVFNFGVAHLMIFKHKKQKAAA